MSIRNTSNQAAIEARRRAEQTRQRAQEAARKQAKKPQPRPTTTPAMAERNRDRFEPKASPGLANVSGTVSAGTKGKSILGGVTGAVGSAVNGVKNGVGGAVRTVRNGVRDAERGASRVGGWAIDRAKDAWNEVRDVGQPTRRLRELNSPGDTLTVNYNNQVGAVVGERRAFTAQFTRRPDGKYTVRMSGELQGRLDQSTGVEAGPLNAGLDASAAAGARVTQEYVATNRAEATKIFNIYRSQALRTIRNGGSLPKPDSGPNASDDQRFLASRLNATELTGFVNKNGTASAGVDAGVNASASAGTSNGGERTERVEYAGGRPVRLLESTTQAVDANVSVSGGAGVTSTTAPLANAGRTITSTRVFDIENGPAGDRIRQQIQDGGLLKRVLSRQDMTGLREDRSADSLSVTTDGSGSNRTTTFTGGTALSPEAQLQARQGDLAGVARAAGDAQVLSTQRKFRERNQQFGFGAKVEGIGISLSYGSTVRDYEPGARQLYAGDARGYPAAA